MLGGFTVLGGCALYGAIGGAVTIAIDGAINGAIIIGIQILFLALAGLSVIALFSALFIGGLERW